METQSHLHEDTPGNGPLLKRDNTTADLLRCHLRLVDRNDRRGDAHTQAADEATDAEHGNVLGCCHQDGTEDPQKARKLERCLSGVLVCDKGRSQRAKETACWHGRRDASLCVRNRVSKVSFVGLGTYDARQGADVEAEKSSACDITYK